MLAVTKVEDPPILPDRLSKLDLILENKLDDLEPKFTNRWFDRNIGISFKKLRELFKINSANGAVAAAAGGPLKVLEIGSMEGNSTIWILKNVCCHPESTLTSIDCYDTQGPVEYVTSDTYKNIKS